MKTRRLIFTALIGVNCIVSCNRFVDSVVKGAVLSQGQTVEAINKNGKIRISYISPTKRKYGWDRKSKVVKMIAREKPFDRKLGLYEPADSWALNPLQMRLVVEEATIDFENMDQIYEFLKQSSDYMDWVYTSDGLVVGFGRAPSRKQINVDLWQILLRGQKPSGMPGARPGQIRLLRSETSK